jgi:hypothetical protein
MKEHIVKILETFFVTHDVFGEIAYKGKGSFTYVALQR